LTARIAAIKVLESQLQSDPNEKKKRVVRVRRIISSINETSISHFRRRASAQREAKSLEFCLGWPFAFRFSIQIEWTAVGIGLDQC
jgi:hypothetical protein